MPHAPAPPVGKFCLFFMKGAETIGFELMSGFGASHLDIPRAKAWTTPGGAGEWASLNEWERVGVEVAIVELSESFDILGMRPHFLGRPDGELRRAIASMAAAQEADKIAAGIAHGGQASGGAKRI